LIKTESVLLFAFIYDLGEPCCSGAVSLGFDYYFFLTISPVGITMIYIPQLMTLAGVMLLACMSPGPDFIAVSSNALGSRRAGMFVALGVTFGCVLWALLAVFGLGILLAKLSHLYSVIRFLGAVYLLFLGGKMLLSARHAKSPLEVSCSSQKHKDSFRRGLFVNLANPKAAVFFGSLFVTILPMNAPLWVHVAAVIIVGIVASCWFVMLAWMFSARRVRRIYDHLRRPIDALMGAALVGLGMKLAVDR
jgi:threonine efflux protein